MKQKLTSIGLALVTLFANLAITLDNPNPGLFTDKWGTTVQALIRNVSSFLLGLSGLVAITFIIYGGYQMMISRGNTQLADQGKKTLTNAIIGLVIVILSYVIVNILINAVLGKI